MSEYNNISLKTRFVRSFLDIIVSRMLLDEPSWGYRLMTRIKEQYGIKVGPPVIYPLLESLESEDIIFGEKNFVGNRLRIIYSVTPKGKGRILSFEKMLREFVN